jgi:hypothetical protein
MPRNTSSRDDFRCVKSIWSAPTTVTAFGTVASTRPDRVTVTVSASGAMPSVRSSRAPAVPTSTVAACPSNPASAASTS